MGSVNSPQDSICHFCGGTFRIRTIDGRRVPLKISCSCPQAGGPTLPLLEDDFTHRTVCGRCGQAPVFFIRHNGGSVFVNHLGRPWPKHGCLLGSSSEIDAIEHALTKIPEIYAADLYQISKTEDNSSGLLIFARDQNNRTTVWRQMSKGAWVGQPGSLIAVCRKSGILVDSMRNTFRIFGPLIKCKTCLEWVKRSERYAHVRTHVGGF